MDIMALSSQLFTTDKDKRRNSAVLLAALAAALIALAQLFIVVAGKFSSKGKKNKQKTKGAKGAPSKGAKASQASQVKAGSGADGGKGSNGKLDSAGAKEAKKQEQRAAPAGVSNNGRASSSTADSSEDEDDRGTAKKSRNSRIAFVEEIPYVVPSDDSKWETVVVKKPNQRQAAAKGNGASTAGATRGGALTDTQRKNAKRAEKRDLIRDLIQESAMKLKESKLTTKAKVKRIPQANNYVIGADFI